MTKITQSLELVFEILIKHRLRYTQWRVYTQNKHVLKELTRIEKRDREIRFP